jgi:hypothetical protein
MRGLVVVLCLALAPVLARAQGHAITFDGQAYVKKYEAEQAHDRFTEFGLDGETLDTWTKLVTFHSFPQSGNDAKLEAGNLIKFIRQRDPAVRFGLIENPLTKEAIVDFLLSPKDSEIVEFNVFKYAPAPDGVGLIAAQYNFRFKLGEVDGEEMKKIRQRAIDEMAKFDMAAVRAHFEMTR